MKKVLTIAGSDCSGGAGIQADLKTFAAYGLYGMSVITALTAQNTTGVFAIVEVDPEFVGKQMDAIFSDIYPDAVKIGMTSNSQLIEIISKKLVEYKAVNIVVDPVMVATSGAALMENRTMALMVEQLFPLASVITPNLDEAGWLIGRKIADVADMESAAQALLDMGAQQVLLKGGHLPGDWVVDLLAGRDGARQELGSQRIPTHNGHGTGCTLSSAIAAYLARGLPLSAAVESARSYILGASAAGAEVYTGRGHGPLNHGFAPQAQLVFTG